jgi:hypothetical protein
MFQLSVQLGEEAITQLLLPGDFSGESSATHVKHEASATDLKLHVCFMATSMSAMDR